MNWRMLFRAVLFSLLTGFYASSALAGRFFENAHISSVRVDFNGKGMIFFYISTGGTPATCGNGTYTTALAFDNTTGGGKAILGFALAVKASGSIVTVHGTGSCAAYGNYVEDWYYGQVY